MSLLSISELSAQCSTSPVIESVINGDFEAGYVSSGAGSFNTDHGYRLDNSDPVTQGKFTTLMSAPMGNTGCAWDSESHFWVGEDIGGLLCDGFNKPDGHPFLTESIIGADHTTGTDAGKRLMIDGKNGTPTDPLGFKFWEQEQIDVIGNESYYFSAWFTNLTPVSTGTNRAQLRFIVTWYDNGGSAIQTDELGATPFSPAETARGDNWEQKYEVTTAPAGAVKADLSIYNQTSNVINGNDVSIDDISFINGCQNLNLGGQTPDLGPDINICLDGDGNITLDAGVAQAANVTYSWFEDDLVNNTGTLFAGGPANTTEKTTVVSDTGHYRICINDGGLCPLYDNIHIYPSVASSAQSVNLCDKDSLIIHVEPPIVAPMMTYSWTAPGGSSMNTSIDDTLNFADVVGTYGVTGTHSNGRTECNVSETFINVTASITAALDVPDINLCETDQLVGTITPASLDSKMTYSWDAPASSSMNEALDNKTNTADVAGTYKLFATHNSGQTGCNDTTTATVTTTPPSVDLGSDIGPICGTINETLTGTLTPAPSLTYSYNWLKDGNLLTSGASNSYTANATGTYRIEAIHPSNSDCNAADELTITSSNPITTNDADYCSTTPAWPTLSATVSPVSGDPANDVGWYSDASLTTKVGSGLSYTPTGISGTQTYYVKDERASNVSGEPALNSAAGCGWGTTSAARTNFDVSQSFTLNSVTMQRGAAWGGASNGIVITVFDASNNPVVVSNAGPNIADGTAISEFQITFPSTTIPAGTGYYMEITSGSAGGSYANWGTSLSGSYPGSITGTAGCGNLFGKWDVSAGSNACGAAPVQAFEVCTTPVDYLYFSASKEKSGTALHWTSTSAKGYYVIERSVNGGDFVSIGTLNAEGTEFNYLDEDVLTGTLYYRVKHVDVSGEVTISEVEVVYAEDAVIATLAPNPFGNVTTLQLQGDTNVAVDVTVINLEGQVVEQYSTTADAQLTLGASLPAGSYIIMVNAGTYTKTLQMIKVN